jgi:SSS family transporter
MDMNVILCIVLMGVVTVIYCTVGGMEAVVWSDVVQGAIFVGGVLFCLVFLIFQTDGGLVGFVSTGYAMNKFHTFDFHWDVTQPMFLFVILGGFANSLITYSSDQTIIQRYMSTKNHRQAVKSIWLNALISIPITVVFFSVGTALYTYYKSHPQLLDVTQDKFDSIFPHYIVTALPVGLSGLLVAAIFAAAMSTLSSNINSFSAAVTEDFVKKVFPNISTKGEMWVARITGMLSGVFGIGIAIWLVFSAATSLWDQFNTFLGLFMSVIGGLFLMGVFSKRINGFGAVCGLCGSLVTIFWIQQTTSLSFLMYGVIGMPACYVIGWLASAMTGFSNVKQVVPVNTNDLSDGHK